MSDLPKLDRPLTARELLLGAAYLIEQGAWTQGANARDVCGNSTSPTHKDAVCWCAFGLLIAQDPYLLVCEAREIAYEAWAAALDNLSALESANDRPTQTAANMARTARLAAARLEGKGE